MASFIMKQMVGGKLNEVKGGIDKLTGDKDGEGGEKTESGEDPEVVAARLEQEERRKERHRKMEREREKCVKIFEDGIGDIPFDISSDGRIVGLIGQLGLTEQVEKAKTAVNEALETVKGFLPFGK
ncbi:putative complexin-1 [Dirofilaria immitis]|nr:putative complexin-1 [Dirofilaria immitis]